LTHLDACIVINLVEQHPPWHERIRDELESAVTTLFAFSPLVQLECLVGPLRQNESRLQRAYQNAFQQFVRLDMPDTVYIDAAGRRRPSAGRTWPGAAGPSTAVEVSSNLSRYAEIAAILSAGQKDHVRVQASIDR